MFGPISCTNLLDFVLTINNADLEQPESKVAEAHYVWQIGIDLQW